MELQKFIEQFALQFEDTERSIFNPNMQFKNLDEWSSLMALTIIAMIDEEYDVRVNGDEMSKVSTIEELFEVVKSKL